MSSIVSLWPCEIDVELGGFVYTLPALPASAWIEAIGSPDGGAIVPGLLNESDQRLFWRDFVAGAISTEEINEGWRACLEAAIGQKWWAGAALILDVVGPKTWPIVHGRLIREGVDLDKISIAAFWNTVYVMALEACKDDQAREEFKFKLNLPPPGYAADAHDPQADADDWMAAMETLQQLQG